MYNKNRKRCADLVLPGDWRREAKEVPLGVQESFWGPLFETESKPDNRRPLPLVEPIYEITAPITKEEVTKALKDAQDGSPGVDGMSRAYVRGIDTYDLSMHMTLWLAARRPPLAFKEGITTLIPKSADSDAPGDFRPITVSAIICRQFHRILASRLESFIPLLPGQKAFRRGDGLADNAVILRSILRDHCAKAQRVCVAFIDVAKAFDTVSHHSVLAACRRLGVPELMVDYLRALYTGGFVSLTSGRSKGTETYRVQRGVRQGVQSGNGLAPVLSG